jgi:hypothetical protein
VRAGRVRWKNSSILLWCGLEAVLAAVEAAGEAAVEAVGEVIAVAVVALTSPGSLNQNRM